MNLSLIERGTKLFVFEGLQEEDAVDIFEAVFRYVESDMVFMAHSVGLYAIYDRLDFNSRLTIQYNIGPNTYRFVGRPLNKQRNQGMVLIEQITKIEQFNLRKYDRDELRFTVSIYGIPKSHLDGDSFKKPQSTPEMSDVSYDISPGGLCIISNRTLNSKYDPYYILEFSLSEKQSFLLPAKLVRRANCQRTKVGKYDYGFQFIFDKIPDEKSRLTKEILSRKLSQI
jgi:hypothetical protein